MHSYLLGAGYVLYKGLVVVCRRSAQKRPFPQM